MTASPRGLSPGSENNLLLPYVAELELEVDRLRTQFAFVEQAARELLLAEASDWQFLISTFAARDYAEIRFVDHIDRFNRLATLAERVHDGGTLTEQESVFVQECMEKDKPFANLDLDLWRPLPEAVSATTA